LLAKLAMRGKASWAGLGWQAIILVYGCCGWWVPGGLQLLGEVCGLVEQQLVLFGCRSGLSFWLFYRLHCQLSWCC